MPTFRDTLIVQQSAILEARQGMEQQCDVWPLLCAARCLHTKHLSSLSHGRYTFGHQPR